MMDDHPVVPDRTRNSEKELDRIGRANIGNYPVLRHVVKLQVNKTGFMPVTVI